MGDPERPMGTPGNRGGHRDVDDVVQERSTSEQLGRWSLAIASLLLLTSMGGGFLLLPVLIPGHIWAARRSSGLARMAWSLLPAASVAAVAWAAVYATVGEAKPAIWLLPTLVLAAVLAVVHRIASAARPGPA